MRTLDVMNETPRRSRVIGNLLDSVLGFLDRSRLTPQGWADRKLDRFHDLRTQRASQDPRWQEIQSLRGPDGLTMISEDVGWPEWHEQRRIAERLTPDPWWMPVLRRVSQVSLVRGRQHAVFSLQRSSRGWSDRDVWNLDRHICATLAGQLQHLADHGHSWPGEAAGWPDVYSWQADLRRQAALLLAYVEDEDVDNATNRWHDLAVRRGAEPESLDAALHSIDELERARTEGAKQALRWVSDHLEYLWD
jgi:hypothetical protein